MLNDFQMTVAGQMVREINAAIEGEFERFLEKHQSTRYEFLNAWVQVLLRNIIDVVSTPHNVDMKLMASILEMLADKQVELAKGHSHGCSTPPAAD